MRRQLNEGEQDVGSITPTQLKVVATTGDYIKSPCKSTRRCFFISLGRSRTKASGSQLNRHCQLLQGLSSKPDAKFLRSQISTVMKYLLVYYQKSLKEIYFWILLEIKSLPLWHLHFHLPEVIIWSYHLISCVMVARSTPEVVAFHLGKSKSQDFRQWQYEILAQRLILAQSNVAGGPSCLDCVTLIKAQQKAHSKAKNYRRGKNSQCMTS